MLNYCLLGMIIFEMIFRETPPKGEEAFDRERYTLPKNTPAGLWALFRDCVCLHLHHRSN